MKLLAVILSIYFLALNVLPCSDTVNAPEDTHEVTAIDFDGEHDQDCELCSPFCQCHCCHVHTVDFGLAAFEPLQPSINEENFAHFDSFGKDLQLSLLQPPQV